MGALPFLRFLTILAAFFCLVSLAWLIARTLALGRKKTFSVPRADARRGVIYAFGRGMMPWEKESAGRHLPTFIGGIIYHSAVFLAFLYLFWLIIIPSVPRPLLPVRLVMAAGLIAGLSLLVKRIIKPHLRRLSCPDDFIANFLVDVFLAAVLLHAFYSALETHLLIISVLLFVYIPFGKIRHCVFFFYTRVVFGIFFGRRGVYPHRQTES